MCLGFTLQEGVAAPRDPIAKGLPEINAIRSIIHHRLNSKTFTKINMQTLVLTSFGAEFGKASELLRRMFRADFGEASELHDFGQVSERVR